MLPVCGKQGFLTPRCIAVLQKPQEPVGRNCTYLTNLGNNENVTTLHNKGAGSSPSMSSNLFVFMVENRTIPTAGEVISMHSLLLSLYQIANS